MLEGDWGSCSAAAAAIKALSGERERRKMHVGQSLSDAPIGLEIDALSLPPSLPPFILATQEAAAVVFLE